MKWSTQRNCCWELHCTIVIETTQNILHLNTKPESPMDAHFSWHSTNLNLVLHHSRIQSQIVQSHWKWTLCNSHLELCRSSATLPIKNHSVYKPTDAHTHTHIYTHTHMHTHLHTQMHKVHTTQTHISIFPFICIIKIRTKWRNVCVCKCYGGVKPRNVTHIYTHAYIHTCMHTHTTHTYTHTHTHRNSHPPTNIVHGCTHTYSHTPSSLLSFRVTISSGSAPIKMTGNGVIRRRSDQRQWAWHNRAWRTSTSTVWRFSQTLACLAG